MTSIEDQIIRERGDVTIDEIMGQADDFARAWADAQTAEIGKRMRTGEIK